MAAFLDRPFFSAFLAASARASFFFSASSAHSSIALGEDFADGIGETGVNRGRGGDIEAQPLVVRKTT